MYNMWLDDFRFATYANIAFRHFTALPPTKPPSSFGTCMIQTWSSFTQLSETTRAREIDAELKKSNWRNEWLDGGLSPIGPLPQGFAPGPHQGLGSQPPGRLLDIFLFFSKTKIFHSHPWYTEWPEQPRTECDGGKGKEGILNDQSSPEQSVMVEKVRRVYWMTRAAQNRVWWWKR